MTFGFSLCAISLLAVLVTYFRARLGNLVGKKPLKSSKV